MNELAKEIAAAALEDAADDRPGAAARFYRFDPGFVGFSGHFPGNPVLPAVVQVRTLVSLAGERAGTPLRLAEVRSAKFLSPVLPGMTVLFRYRRRGEPGEGLYDADVSVDGKAAATFLLRLADREDD